MGNVLAHVGDKLVGEVAVVMPHRVSLCRYVQIGYILKHHTIEGWLYERGTGIDLALPSAP